MNHSNLHAVIVAYFLDKQRPPTVAELGAHFQREEADVRKALQDLQAYHGVVLHPHSDEVWVAHPFSAAPTTCVVRTESGTWWGNCVWCSLGLAHLAGGTATLETRTGALDEPVSIRIEGGKVIDTDFAVRFPVTMTHAWDNVMYTCSVMLAFRNEAQVDDWCRLRGIPKGDVRPIAQIGAFAAEWYAKHADYNWEKWTVREAGDLFTRHGLTGPIWALPEASERFTYPSA